ncbi:hypothetical protein SteCoe_26679 [Stentor coeruleus]|uniref:Uncharacterized protein n=1 Tax=Stentor coeruleus TaxID=5963 RepID=A0A1R2BCN2_9CILI|nr:hypothetical protein SteCoe_26679 [Stentor coeruleus]
MNTVPESGDVIIHYYLPSGARLELQIYFTQDEHPEQVVQRLFESEGLTCTIIPDILRLLSDLFKQYRRVYPLSIPQTPINSFLLSSNPWKKYSVLFQNPDSIKTLKGLALEIGRSIRKAYEKKTQLLLLEENRYSESNKTGNDTSKEHYEIIQKIEEDIHNAEKLGKEEFWKFVNSAEVPKKHEYFIEKQETFPEVSVQVALGSHNDRVFTIKIVSSDDVCNVPRILVADGKDLDDDYLGHPDNVYKRAITCLVLYCTCQENVELLPDLIRKSEESPELHFDSIRNQIPLVIGEGEIVFTRHSNIPSVQGAFHITEVGQISSVVNCANIYGVKQIVFPVYEWELVKPVSLVSVVKAALFNCTLGDLEIVSFLVENTEDIKDILNAVKLVFSESISSVS